ncbi:Uu.00g097920.m01.CDS01 [Anthostomella pinea]|uniref:Uu.00g097920.m01.CDS01 n=1 Tax=Anthostomella pinea TaxID=933095 RepID=A0AAI8YF77_9PEZI|nr:Uu.00g097920.m01.CDS01 [Anthostomella pinea]
MADPSSSLLWTVILLVTALLLALIVTTHILSSYTIAYLAAPREINTFIDAVDFSIQENESYDCDVARVPRLEDKVRLGRLLREIQKGGDDLREDLNQLVVAEGGTTLHTSARILWASHRRQLEDRVRRLDILRMRFLVVYMGIVATSAGERGRHAERTTPKDIEKTPIHTPRASRPGIHKSLTDSIKQRPPLRRLATQAMGHNEKTEQPHRTGWMGVVQELQRSPLMQKRHASIEEAMRSPPVMTPLGSPLALSPIARTPSPMTIDS